MSKKRRKAQFQKRSISQSVIVNKSGSTDQLSVPQEKSASVDKFKVENNEKLNYEYAISGVKRSFIIGGILIGVLVILYFILR